MLAENCFKCHGEAKQKGGLRLDSLAAMVQGGDTGPAVVPGKLDESLLVEAVNYEGLEMPPGGKLGDAQRARAGALGRDGGPLAVRRSRPAAAPADVGAEVRRSATRIGPSGRSSRCGARPSRTWPTADGRRTRSTASSSPGWRPKGSTPAPEADRRTLIRRASFDLIGLPPTPEEVDAFVADDVARRLRTARRPPARRARATASAGRGTGSTWSATPSPTATVRTPTGPTPGAIATTSSARFNDDKPYDRFVPEQLAGDEIAPGDPEARGRHRLPAAGHLRVQPARRAGAVERRSSTTSPT